MRFTKMHGCGNDYVYVNCFTETVPDPSSLAVRVSDRHFGIGSDGLILICPSDKADFQMKMYNADGSEGAMCGNGIRCVAKYVYDYGLTDKTEITVETKSGIKTLTLFPEQGKISRVTVNMGTPKFQASAIPVLSEAPEILNQPISVKGSLYHMTCVSMGNPHAVVPVKDVAHFSIEETGPLFEKHPCFPDRVNTEFIQILDDHSIRMRVWERGSGETLACGTGACAAAVASIQNGWVTEGEVTVKLLGGELSIRWDRQKNQVFLTGPAVTVFDGELAE